VHRTLAFVAERDAALRRLLTRILQNVAFDVCECASEAQLQEQLRDKTLAWDQRTLLVVSAALAGPSLARLGDATRVRGGDNPPDVCVILTFEFGAIEQLPTPEGCRMIALLEKPFDLDQFERLASACRSPAGEAAR
jgi:DNA-binding NtrC family response regulator